MGAGSVIAPAYSASKFAIRGLTQAAGTSHPELSVDHGFIDEGSLKLPISGNTELP